MSVVVCALLVLAQSQSTEYVYDLNGRRVPLLTGASTNGTTRTGIPSANGREVALETVEEQVLEDGPSGRVIERTLRRNSPDGVLLPPEKIRVEERRNSDGSTTMETTVYRGDINGRLNVAERQTTETRRAGDQITASTTVARPTINGGLDVVERRETTGRETKTDAQEDTVVYRRDANGNFTQAVRLLTEKKMGANSLTETVTEYQAATASGQLELSGQRTTRERRNADGTVLRETDLFGTVAAGRACAGKLVLREQQRVEQTRTDGGVVESFSIRRPDITDQRVGGYVKISERVCTGNCLAPAKPQP